MELRRLAAERADFRERFAALLAARQGEPPAREVAEILAGVRAGGDRALLEYARRHDGAAAAGVAELAWDAADFRAAYEAQPRPLRDALRDAAERIRAYAERQRLEPFDWVDEAGSRLGQAVRALERVAVYAPGGRAAYPSSVLMAAVPARAAGVDEVVLASPGDSPAVKAAAHVAGVDRGWSLGGAHALAAFAYGTETVPKVDKIAGPGNAWVTEAKRQLYGAVGIDLLAGPSEIVIVSDGSVNPHWLASDLLAQAEHDEDAQAVLIGLGARHLDEVAAALEAQLPDRGRRAIIEASLERHGALIEAESVPQALELADAMAPEHLQLALAEPGEALARVRHAAAVFLGAHSAEVLGDYCAGPNHVLPTGGAARYASPLGADAFQKRITVQELTPAGARRLAGTAEILARAEGLDGHALAARWRRGGG